MEVNSKNPCWIIMIFTPKFYLNLFTFWSCISSGWWFQFASTAITPVAKELKRDITDIIDAEVGGDNTEKEEGVATFLVRKKKRKLVQVKNDTKFTFTDLPEDLIILIASYLEWPHKNVGFINKFTAHVMFKRLTLGQLVPYLYFRYGTVELTDSMDQFSFHESSELSWFLQSFGIPHGRLLKNYDFLILLTTALTQNLYFPQNEKEISKLLLRAIITSGPNNELEKRSRLHQYNMWIFGTEGSILSCLGDFFVKTEQFGHLLDLLTAFPNIEEKYFDSQKSREDFEFVYKSFTKNGLNEGSSSVCIAECKKLLRNIDVMIYDNRRNTEAAEYFEWLNSEQVIVLNLEINDIMNEFSSKHSLTKNNPVTATIFEEKFDLLVNRIISYFRGSVNKLCRLERYQFKSLMYQVLKWAFETVRMHSPSLSDQDFANYIRILMKWNFRGTFAEESATFMVSDDHEFILRILTNLQLHQFFKHYLIKMSSQSILSIIRSPDLFETFTHLFSQFGYHLVEFEYFDALQFLRPDLEYKMFQELTDLDLSACLISKYLKTCPNQTYQSAANAKYFIQHRSIFLYCLHDDHRCGNLIEMGLILGLENNFNLFIWIQKDSKQAKNKLIQDFQAIFEYHDLKSRNSTCCSNSNATASNSKIKNNPYLSNLKSEQVEFLKSQYNEIFMHFH